MKRYDIGLDGFDGLECVESPTGEYVKFDDLKAHDNEIRLECADRAKALYRSRHGVYLESTLEAAIMGKEAGE